jgi:hypothetical protein
MLRIVLVAALIGLSGCMTASAVSAGVILDTKTGDECKATCEQLGMSLGAVVIIRNSAGCVCTPGTEAGGATTGGGAATAGGMAALMLDEAAQQQQSTPAAAPPGR